MLVRTSTYCAGASLPARSSGDSTPVADGDQVTLGQLARELEQAGVTFSCQKGWLGGAEPITPPEVERRLHEEQQVLAQTPEGCEKVSSARELCELEALYGRDPQDELAARIRLAHSARVSFSYGGGESLLDVYHQLGSGREVPFVFHREELSIKSLEDLKVATYLFGLDPDLNPEELEHPGRARSLKLLCDTGQELHWGNAEGRQAVAMRLYHAGHRTLSVMIAGMLVGQEELDDPARVADRLRPLLALNRVVDSKNLPYALRSLEELETSRPAEEQLEATRFAYSWGTYGHRELCQSLLEGDEPMEQRLELARQLQCRLPADAEPVALRTAWQALGPHPRPQFLELLEKSGSSSWAAHACQSLGPDAPPDRVHKALWSHLAFHHPTIFLQAWKPVGAESAGERKEALASVYGGCRANMADLGEVWSQVRGHGDLTDAMAAHDRLLPALRALGLQRPGRSMARCLELLRQESPDSLSQGAERLAPLLHNQNLLGDQQAEKLVSQALARFQQGPARAAIEEHAGAVVVGGVRLPTRPHD